MPKDDGMGEKTEDATPKKREESREQGQVAKSQDLSGAVLMLTGFAILKVLGPWFGNNILAYFRWPIANLDSQIDSAENYIGAGQGAFAAILIFLSPFLAALFLLAGGVTAMQVGLKFAPKAFEIKPDKLDPIKGFGKIFSIRSLTKVGFGIAKISVVSAVVYSLLSSELPNVVDFQALFDYREDNTRVITFYMVDMICWLGIYAGGTLTIIGFMDFAYQKWQQEQDMKMSKQEIKDEMKNMEGDPMLKRKRMERGRQIAMSRNLDSAGEADVVVTNPTHYSICIRYSDNDPAPRVTGKGKDHVALKMREIATANQVPIVEKPELARALYRLVEIDEMIPDEFWTPVAEILAYVYNIDKRKRDRAIKDDAPA